MSDLISRAEAIEKITSLDENVVKHSSDMKILAVERIKRLPVAYDKEAVENEVHNMRLDLTSHCRDMFDSDNECENLECTECVLSKVEQVIKAGGIDG